MPTAPTTETPIVLKKDAVLTGEYVTDAKVLMDQWNSPYVSLTFNSRGGQIFANLTGENVNKRMAIVLDGKGLFRAGHPGEDRRRPRLHHRPLYQGRGPRPGGRPPRRLTARARGHPGTADRRSLPGPGIHRQGRHVGLHRHGRGARIHVHILWFRRLGGRPGALPEHHAHPRRVWPHSGPP